MFTGLIQCKGRVLAVEPRGKETRLKIQPMERMENIILGESIAVNGVCLTVETEGGDWFTAYASGETLRLTSLGDLRIGDFANLERALALGDRLGGHLVSGHVDCLAHVESITPAGESKIYRLAFPAEHGPFVVPKGSITLDGISLTINECGDNFLTVNIIPATQNETTIALWAPGRKVNMETDLIGKYVQRMLGAWTGKTPEGKNEKPGGLTESFFRQHGF